jgi:hypothetical protein
MRRTGGGQGNHYALDHLRPDANPQCHRPPPAAVPQHEAIAAFPNDAFHDERLEIADRNADWTLAGMDAVEHRSTGEGS